MNEAEELLLTILEDNGAALLSSGREGIASVGKMIAYLEREGVVFSPAAMGIAGQYYYAVGQTAEMERCLTDADIAFGAENRFAIYRQMYRALLHYDTDAAHYVKLLNNASFYLHEHGEPLPFLLPQDEKRLAAVRREQEGAAKQLCVRTLGGFSVTAKADGRELPWRTRKGRELFAYLLELEGQTIDRSHLIEVLWPEEIPKNAVALLHNMIYNMRKELSAYSMDGIVVYEKKRYRLLMDDIQSDSVLLHRVMDAVRRVDMEELSKEKEFFLSYQGAYLKDIDSPWADAVRQAWDEAFRMGCMFLAEDAELRRDYETAVKLYDNILAVSPYEESAAAKLLELYTRQRRWEKREECFKSFAARMEEDLGIAPGEEVLLAYEMSKAKAG
ncbi:MAG: hypothetical protein IJT32_00600 [Lachnospiraceae bacterium]|nr:hypothetical protein [Lachnospiraceae bacterium]